MDQLEQAINLDPLPISSISADHRLDNGLGELLIGVLPAGVYMCDASGRIVRFNQKAADLWGRAPRLGESEERFCGAHKLFWPDGRPLGHDQTPMAEVLRTGKPAADLEVKIERPDGSRIWVSVNIVPLLDEAGVLIGAVNCFQDITARKHAEEELRRSREFLAAVFDTTPEWIKVVDPDGRLLQTNASGPTMVEADDPGQILGAAISDVIAPEFHEQWRENHRRVCQGESLTWEFDIIGLRGTRRHMETHATPLALPDGTRAQLSVTRDISQRKRDGQALADNEQRLRSLLDALPTAVYTTDADGAITFFNEAAAELWGRRPELGEHWCGSACLFATNGTPLPLDECPMAIALKEQRPVRNVEAILERPDGTRVPFMPFPTPLRDSAGKLIGAVNMLVDISYHKEATDKQHVLINELNHRVKNTLVTVQSIATLTMRTSGSPGEFRDAFGKRLTALSKAHDLLTSSSWHSVKFRSLVEQELAPYVGGSSQVYLSGQDVKIGARQAVTLAMVLHELTTNAVKYGALSSLLGRVDVAWDDRDGELSLSWTETGGPSTQQPSRKGFGTSLIERSVRGELRGVLDMDFTPVGLRCSLRFPREGEQHGR